MRCNVNERRDNGRRVNEGAEGKERDGILGRISMKQSQTCRLNMIKPTFISVVQPVGTRQAGTCCREGYYGLPPPSSRSGPHQTVGSSLLATSCFSTHFPGTWEMGISYGNSEVLPPDWVLLQAGVGVGHLFPGSSCPGFSASLENERVPG